MKSVYFNEDGDFMYHYNKDYLTGVVTLVLSEIDKQFRIAYPTDCSYCSM